MTRHRLHAAGIVATLAVSLGALAIAKAQHIDVPDRGPWLQGQLAVAPDGAVIDVPPGEYQGPFVIERRVHLRGGGRATLRGDKTTHVVAVRAPDVVIEGFAVRDSGLDLGKDHAAIHVTAPRAVIRDNHITHSLHGVYVRQADDVRVEGNTIIGASTIIEKVDPATLRPTPGAGELCEIGLDQNRRGNALHFWNSSGHVIARNVVRDTRDGVYFSFVDRSEVRDNDIARVRYGLHYMYSDDNHFAGNVFHDNAAGAALMFSTGIVLERNRFMANRSHRAYGLLFQTVDNTEVRANRIVGNTVGLFIDGGHENRFVDNRVAANHLGVRVSDSSDANTFAGNTFAGNLHTVETTGGRASSRWSSDGRGNHWDNAMRLDLDRNGIGDLPHRELDVFGPLRRPFPAIGLLIGSPGERLLRFVHARIALPGMHGVTDPVPLIEATQP